MGLPQGTAAATSWVDPDALAPDPGITLRTSYKAPSKRGWALIVKAPDDHVGKGLKLWACIWQFDAATGENGFLANASCKRQKYWNLDGE